MRLHRPGLTLAALFLAACAVTPASAEEYGATVWPGIMPSDGKAYSVGETQSVVLPPGTPACPAGRVLVTNDALRPEQTGAVRILALDGGAATDAAFTGLPRTGTYWFGTNDHDLVATGDGTVYYIIGAFSKKPVGGGAQPPWFDLAWRLNANPRKAGFGPGARSVVLAYRSTDCGGTFRYQPQMEMDPAVVGDGTCAFPQLPYTQDLARPGRPWTYDAGGSDGQLAEADESGNKILLTFGCVGFNRDASATAFRLDANAPLSKTLVLQSIGGSGWSLVQTLPFSDWRLGVRSIGPFRYYGKGAGIFYEGGQPIPATADITNRFAVMGPDTDGWAGLTGVLQAEMQNPRPASYVCIVCTNVGGSTVTGRLPGAIVTAYPAEVGAGAARHGFKLQILTLSDSRFYAQFAIEPKATVGPSLIEHVVFAKTGSALLAYWTDVNYQTQTTQVRGRWIFDRLKSTADFDISDPVAFKAPGNQWYGDYYTANGYIESFGPVFTAYPVWSEGDGAVHVAKVEWTPGMLPAISGTELRKRPKIYRVTNETTRNAPIVNNRNALVVSVPVPPAPPAGAIVPRHVPIDPNSASARILRNYRRSERVREQSEVQRELPERQR